MEPDDFIIFGAEALKPLPFQCPQRLQYPAVERVAGDRKGLRANTEGVIQRVPAKAMHLAAAPI